MGELAGQGGITSASLVLKNVKPLEIGQTYITFAVEKKPSTFHCVLTGDDPVYPPHRYVLMNFAKLDDSTVNAFGVYVQEQSSGYHNLQPACRVCNWSYNAGVFRVDTTGGIVVDTGYNFNALKRYVLYYA